MKIKIPLFSTSLSKEAFVYGIRYDQEAGYGTTQRNKEAAVGLTVLMKANTFIELVLPVDNKETLTEEFYRESIEKGDAIASPWIDIELKSNEMKPIWDDAKVRDYEGLNRVKAIRAVRGDVEVLVHLFFPPYKVQDIGKELEGHLSNGVIAQSGHFIPGPLWRTP
jgi:hypothetical protein